MTLIGRWPSLLNYTRKTPPKSCSYIFLPFYFYTLSWTRTCALAFITHSRVGLQHSHKSLYIHSNLNRVDHMWPSAMNQILVYAANFFFFFSVRFSSKHCVINLNRFFFLMKEDFHRLWDYFNGKKKGLFIKHSHRRWWVLWWLWEFVA